MLYKIRNKSRKRKKTLAGTVSILCYSFIICPQTNGRCCIFNLSPKYALRVHISSEGRCSYPPFPSPLFQSQVGHSLIRQVASLLSPKLNCMHYDVTTQCFCRGLSIKKEESYYSKIIRKFKNLYFPIQMQSNTPWI